MADPVLGPNAGPDRIHKPPTPSSSQHSSGSGLNPRSCVTCRRRKVRCDKHHPCSNCQKAHIECIFPAPGRAPRRPRKPPDGELLSRLRRLEGVVQSLGASVDEDGHAITTSPSGMHDYTSPSHSERGDVHRSNSLDHSFGKLAISDGKSRYVNNTFWAGLSNELEDLKVILDEGSDSEGDYPTPETDSVSSPSHQGFLFGQHGFHASDLHSLHPPAKVIMEYWKAYVANFDAVMRMFHIPTMEASIEAIKDNPAKGHKGMEALLFAIYYAATNSLSEEQCQSIAGEPRETLVGRYRFATEQALARANLLVTEELVVFQAFIILVMCLRRTEDSRLIWSLCGLVIRIAITLGLHRDGTNFGLSPFETEMRRRTYWNMMSLDMRTSEDHGCDATIMDHAFDTMYPLNVEDADIEPSMEDFPAEREGITGMSFCLARYEIIRTLRKLSHRPEPADYPDSDRSADFLTQDKERWIRECQETLDHRFLRHCDMSIPYHWVVCTVSKLVTGKMWLVLYNPFLRDDKGAGLPEGIKDRLFEISLQSLECSLALDTSPAIAKWGWLFRSYNQWHALAYTLLELCTRTRGPKVERAWRVVDATIAQYGAQLADTKKGHLWKLLRKLVDTAKRARAQGLALEANAPQEQSNLNELANGAVPVTGENVPLEMKLQDVRLAPNQGLDTPESGYFSAMPAGDAMQMPYAEANGQRDINAVPGPSNGNLMYTSNPALVQQNWPAMAQPPNQGMMMDNTGWAPNPNMPGFNLANNAALGGYGGPPGRAYLPHDMPNLSQPENASANGNGDKAINPAREALGNDPMVSGSDNQGTIWDDWDDMMREFELESGQDGALSRWSSRPMMNEAWL